MNPPFHLSAQKTKNSLIRYQESKQNLSVPEGTVHIDLWAYARSSIVSVWLPDSLRTMGMCAFRDCKELKTVSLSVNTYCNYKLEYQAGDGIFSGCTALEEVELRGSIKNFTWFDAQAPELLRGFHPERTFYNCNKLKRMIAHEVPLSAFPSQWKRYAVNGYLADEERKKHYLPEVAAEYDAYLTSIRTQLINRTELDHSYALHHYLIEQEMIEEEEIDLLLSRARNADAADVAASLLTYQKEHFQKNDFLSLLEDELNLL